VRRPTALALILTAACCVSCTGTGPEPVRVPGPVRFFREHVRVEPSDGRTRVVGHYFFRNAADDSVSTAISYPFPVDLHHARPFRVLASVRKDGEFRPLGFHHESDSVRWKMNFAPREEHEVRIEYTQEISRKHAVYIVTTTSMWGEPIELAEFEFRLPADLGGVEFSFEPDSVEDLGDTVVYLLERRDFMPERDFSVTWQ
jgi:hypothetical protein